VACHVVTGVSFASAEFRLSTIAIVPKHKATTPIDERILFMAPASLLNSSAQPSAGLLVRAQSHPENDHATGIFRKIGKKAKPAELRSPAG